MAGSAGSIMSIDNAMSAVIVAINATNSPRGIVAGRDVAPDYTPVPRRVTIGEIQNRAALK
jgi:hypothetical protein